MSLPSIKIGKYTLKYPIIQGGMGLGISWDKLAGSVSKAGGLGVISTVGTGYYENQKYAGRSINNRPYEAKGFYSREGLHAIIQNARKISGDAPLAVNAMCASSDYSRIVRDACEGGIDIIITGAGLPTNLPEFTKDFPDIALVPIVSSAKALKIICKRWKQRYDRLPDAVVLEGPKSGGHQGFTYEQCFEEDYQLENLIKPLLEEAKNWGDFPIFTAGGIWNNRDIRIMLALGASGVQMGTRFIGTHECDASDVFKQVILNAKKEDIKLLKSPVGYPARGVQTPLIHAVAKREGPAIKCISNCVVPCQRGKEAREVGYCIADRLADAYLGDEQTGLFFIGSNGHLLNEIISVEALMDKLVHGEES